MKKSLSLLLAIAMVFSLFAGVASAADNGKTALEKFNELKAKGIFAGIDEKGTPGLDQPMTRAQYARVAALILGLQGISPNGDTKVVTEKPFKDVELDAWFVEEVAAVKEAGIMVGNPDGTFNPNGNITVQELAVVTAQSLGLTPVKDAKVEGADDWAAGYIQALLNEGINFPTNYKEPATREQLVVVAYEMNQVVNPEEPEKVSVVSAKPIGVQKVEVKLDKAVDKNKATFSLKKGSVNYAVKAEFQDDKTVVLTLTASRINAGEYTVTLSGLDASTVAKATATFTAEDEKVESIEFVSASDTIAYSKKATVKLRALNQYGETASYSQAQFTAYVNGATPDEFKKDAQGYLTITHDITKFNGIVQGSSQIPVTVYFNDTRVTANKVFKVGNIPILSKVELSDVEYSNGGTSLKNGGDTAKIPLKLYDQYGNPVVKGQFDAGEIQYSTLNAVIVPYNQYLTYKNSNSDKFDNDGNPQVLIELTGKDDKTATYTVNVYAGSSSASTTINVGAGNIPVKVEFGTFNDVIAANDVVAYIPIVAYDADGKQLTQQEIADNAGRFTLSATNADSVSIQQYGEHKGKIKIDLKSGLKEKDVVYVTALIATPNANSYAQTQITVQPARVPDHFVIDTEPAAKAILGASSDVVWILRDQYGKKMDNIPSGVVNLNGESYDYRVTATISGDTATSGITVVDKKTQGDASKGGFTLDDTTKTVHFSGSRAAAFNEGFTFKTNASKTGKVTLKVVVERKKTSETNWAEYSGAVSRTIEAIKPDTKLTYALETNANLYTTLDSKNSPVVSDYQDPDPDDKTKTAWTIADSFFAKKVKVVARDSSGATVKLPNNAVRGISSTNESIVTTYYGGGDDGYVIGNKAGTATVTVVVYTNEGTTVLLTQDFTVKNEPFSVQSLTAKKTTATVAPGTTRTNVFTLFEELKVKDQYGYEYKNADIAKYHKYLNVLFTISSVQGGLVTIDQSTGDITIGTGVKDFVVTATAPNGKSVELVVEIK